METQGKTKRIHKSSTHNESTRKKLHFTIESGNLIVTDPCYDENTWCLYKGKAAKGKWRCTAIQRGSRVSELHLTSLESKPVATMSDKGFVRVNATIGVDSGQLGFFDADFYHKDEEVAGMKLYDFGENWDPLDHGDEFYRACCHITIEEDYGQLPHGVVTRSGYGDGVFPLFVKYDSNGDICEAYIKFF